MAIQKVDLHERIFNFSIGIILFLKSVKRDELTKNFIYQLSKSSTAIGSNFHEAQGASSKKDFLNKLCICHKEAKETLYWLQLLRSTHLVAPKIINPFINESDEIVRILGSSVGKIRRKLRKSNS